jgi:hypothetical protein
VVIRRPERLVGRRQPKYSGNTKLKRIPQGEPPADERPSIQGDLLVVEQDEIKVEAGNRVSFNHDEITVWLPPGMPPPDRWRVIGADIADPARVVPTSAIATMNASCQMVFH